MSAIHDALAYLRAARAAIDDPRRSEEQRPDSEPESAEAALDRLFDELRITETLDRVIGILADVRPVCLNCGADNHRRGDFCQDRCRTAYGREHSPPGRVRSVRRLARGRGSITVHFETSEVERALRFLPGATVYVVPEREP